VSKCEHSRDGYKKRPDERYNLYLGPSHPIVIIMDLDQAYQVFMKSQIGQVTVTAKTGKMR
jgi:hypothetical protein